MPSIKNRSVRPKEDPILYDNNTKRKNTSTVYDDDIKTLKSRRSSRPGAIASWAYLVSILCAIFFVSYNLHYALPKPKIEGRNSATGELQFSEGNVRALTAHLSENIGLRIIGTEPLDDTERFLIREIKGLQEQAKVQAATGHDGLPNFDMWTQVNDGSHRFDFMSKGKCYSVGF